MIQFMKLKWVSLLASIIVISFSIFYTFSEKHGFRKGIDFSGGIKLEIELNDKVTVEKLRESFKKLKISATVLSAGKGFDNISKVEIGSQDSVGLEKEAEKDAKYLAIGKYSANSVDYLNYLISNDIYGDNAFKVNFISSSHVGPTVGDYLQKSAIKLLLWALLFIMVYITVRFQFDYAIAAIVALIHDLLITMSFIGVFQIPLSIPVIAALLTILGYSVMDTVVIFDRLRENLHKTGNNIAFEKQVNISITETLSRSFNTTLTTLISILAIYLIADETLRDMASVLLFGISVGAYSSNMVASPVLVIWNQFKKKN
ncbi:MAG: protein translocase subunit SecF [Spirochaetia bacterium]|nr:protein translocase subunit SecF [Spirochaetia bacterium]